MATEKSTPALNLADEAILASLEPRREPRWMEVKSHDGLWLGYRKMPETLAVSWLVRWPDANAAGGRKEQSLRTQLVGKLPTYENALKAAIALFDGTRLKGHTTTEMTVKQLVEAYAAKMEKGGERLQLKCKVEGPRPDAAAKLLAAAGRWIFGDKDRGYAVDPICHVKLKNLAEGHFSAWRARMLAAPTTSGKPLSDASINKELQCLRAPLNHGKDIMLLAALQHGLWKGPLEKLDTEESNAKRELDMSHADIALVAKHATPQLQNFMRLMLRTSFRPGACVHIDIPQFKYVPNGESTITVRKDKTKKATGRTVGIPADLAKWINDTLLVDANGNRRIGNQPLLVDASGKRWTTREWGRAFKKARNAAFPRHHINRTACMYTMRHRAITDLIAANVPTAMVAHWSGTSIKQIEDTYLKHKAADAATGLAALAVNF